MSRRPLSVLTASALALGLVAFGVLPAHAASVESVPIAGSPDEIRELVEFDGALYFSGDNGTDHVLYTFDGASVAAVLGSPAGVQFVFAHGDALFFQAFGTGGNSQLFSFDGTAFTEIAGADDASQFTDFGGVLHFIAEPAGVNRLFALVAGVPTEVVGTPDDVGELGVAGGVLYFEASNGVDQVLWSYDGVAAPTEVPGSPTDIAEMVEFAGELHFTAFDGTGQIYSYNSTDGIQAVPGTNIDAMSLAVFAGILYFAGNNGAYYSLHAYDGSTVREVAALPEAPGDFFEFDGVLYFSAWDPDGLRRLYVFDGSDISLVAGPARYPRWFAALGDELYFGATASDESESIVLFGLIPSASQEPAPGLPPTGADLVLPLGAGALLLLMGGVMVTRRSVRS